MYKFKRRILLLLCNLIPFSKLRRKTRAKLLNPLEDRFIEQYGYPYKYLALKKKELLKFLNGLPQDEEIKEIKAYLKRHYISHIPYFFTEKYKSKYCIIFKDEKSNMRYCLYKGKKMFFPKSWTEKLIKRYMWMICPSLKKRNNNETSAEQDLESPHRYTDEKLTVEENDILLDLGAAEGIFALDNIEKIKQAYLFECDQLWIEALEKTFEPWKDKVIIIKKYVSDKTAGDYVALDDFFTEFSKGGGLFIKADLEGFETAMLHGAQRLLQDINNLKLAITTYHRANADRELNEILTGYGFTTSYTNKHIFPYWEADWDDNYMRKGIIRAYKKH
jgi:hypothetical protein